MKIPLSWLKEYIPTKLSAEQISALLTACGLEVESIQNEILEITLTPNLAHSASIRGVARELAAITGEALHHPKFSVVEKKGDFIHRKTSVTVDNPISCPRYCCRLITGIKVAPSPDWLKQKIEQCGFRSVNNVVDITNLVLLEWGHPLHAFDFDQLEERRIVVRNAKKAETIIALDGKKYYPTENTLLICDAKRPIAIAGIMGSQESEVSEKTTTILLESAYFKPSQIRSASKRMGIQSEASYRFERGTDPNGVIEALERATSWICALAHGTVLEGILDVKSQEFQPKTLACRLSRTNNILGTQLAMSEVETIFKRQFLGISHIKDDVITVTIPTYRHDLHHEIDLIEEVARIYGYDHIHQKKPTFYRTGQLPHSPEYLFAKKARCRLIAEGLQECLSCDLISPMQAGLISPDNFPSRTLIKLLNPRSLEQSIMRPSMLPSMLNVVKYNADHGINAIAGFEVGRIHFMTKERYFEPSVAAIILTGERTVPHWESKETCVDFFDLKGIVENFLEGLKLKAFSFVPSHFSNFHPGRQAAILFDNAEIGIMGEIHPATLKKIGLEHPVYFAELNLEELLKFVPSEIKMQPLPQFPASTRDWTVTLPIDTPIATVCSLIHQESSQLLEAFYLLDIYTSEKIGANRKNATFRFVYRDLTKTISLSAVEHEHQRIIQKLVTHLKGEIS